MLANKNIGFDGNEAEVPTSARIISSHTIANLGAIEDYLISTNPVQQWNPKWTPGWIDEALAWKGIDEQIDIINKLNAIMDNTNRNPNFIDAWWVQRDLQNQQQQAPAQPQEQEQQQDQQQQEQQQPEDAHEQLSKEQAQQLLDALMQDEEEVQEKVKELQMQQSQSRKTDKDW